MELVKYEHRKLWRRKSVQIGVFLCFLYSIIFGGLLSYQWFGFGSQDDFTSSFGNNFDGYSNIRKKQEYAKQWEGNLTDETLQAMVRDYQKRVLEDEVSGYEITDWRTLNSWIKTCYPELEDTKSPYIMLRYVDASKLTNFNERREKVLENFLDMNWESEKEKEYFLDMNKKVEIPLQYRWSEGWAFVTTNFIDELGILIAIFLAVAIAPMFSNEYHDNTRALIATTKNGWETLAGSKVIVSFLFALELYTLLTVSSILLQIIFLGTSGSDMPIQCIKLIAAAPWTVIQAEVYEYAYLLLATLGYTGIVLLCSALTKSNFISLLLSLALLFVPRSISQFLPLWGQKLIELIPFIGTSTDIFRTNTYHLFGKIIWSPYLLITIPVLLGLINIPFVVKQWSKRENV